MTSAFKTNKRVLAAVAGTAAFALALTGCQAGEGSSGGGSESLIVGTTDKVTYLDPAGSYDSGSFAIMNQVYPFLLNSPLGTAEVEPDIAISAEYTSDLEYTVVLKDGLTFANGNPLTSSDVKFSFDRVMSIKADTGPHSLLGNLKSVDAVDDTTVVFTLNNANDQTFEQILSSPAAPIVDEDVFSATSITSDEEIVEGMAFAGQYSIDSYDFNNIVSFTANPDYQGVLGAPATDSIRLKFYTDASNLKLDVQEGNIDVAHRSLSATDTADLEQSDKVNVIYGPGGEIRYIVFNFDTQPFGAKTPEADAEKSLAVRGAVADLIDRREISDQVYKGSYLPLYSFVPDGLPGATRVLEDLYGDGDGGPSVEAAKTRLAEAGVDTPIKLNLQYNPDHYGESSGDEYALIESQLEVEGIFDVSLQSTEWVTYSAERTKDAYPAYQLGWFPDYSDADNYLTPFFGESNFLGNHYSDSEVNDLIVAQAGELDPATREGMIEEIQAKVAAQLSTVPFLQGSQTVITGKDITGATLDGSFKFRYGSLAR